MKHTKFRKKRRKQTNKRRTKHYRGGNNEHHTEIRNKTGRVWEKGKYPCEPDEWNYTAPSSGIYNQCSSKAPPF